MANFKPVVRSNKEFNTVYIRISHGNGKIDYIKTSMFLHKSGIQNGEIVDYTILANCYREIQGYSEKLNKIDYKSMTIQELKKFLTTDSDRISFSAFARKFIHKMREANRWKPAKNYDVALRSFESFMKSEDVLFSDINSKKLTAWIESISHTARAKQMYPVSIKRMFEVGLIEYNDYDNDVILIKNQPFRSVIIPEADVPKKRFVNVENIRTILSISPESPRENLAHDIILIVLGLAGINTVDLYEMSLQPVSNGKICYNRAKTKAKRKDKAYFEITVPDMIVPLFERHKGKEYLFNFKERYADADTFSQNVNKGLKSLCEKAGVDKITVYWLRHSWATIAINKCGATLEQVAFCLNHSSAHKVTEMYIEKDFSPVDTLNEKVLNILFNIET
ncbi:MAG: site-specific integrase [Tannerella sp.]|jgi:site-specific recombinase XerD|nr:site-specific integrase [Tannerella sp.]